jgi:hypothetical protein
MLYEVPVLMAEIVEFENTWGDEARGQTGRDSAVSTIASGRCELLLPHYGLGYTLSTATLPRACVLSEQTVNTAVVSR